MFLKGQWASELFFLFFFFGSPGSWTQGLYLLGRHLTAWAMPPAPQWTFQTLILKSIGLSCTWNVFFNVHFLTACVSHLENIGLLSYEDFSNGNLFHCPISKIAFVEVASNLIRKSCIAHGDGYKFSKILIFFYSKDLSLVINTVNCLP
jgi:hypothetical protein